MTPTQTTQIIDLITAYWGRNKFNPTQDEIKVWIHELADRPAADVLATLERYKDAGQQWPPGIMDLTGHEAHLEHVEDLLRRGRFGRHAHPPLTAAEFPSVRSFRAAMECRHVFRHPNNTAAGNRQAYLRAFAEQPAVREPQLTAVERPGLAP